MIKIVQVDGITQNGGGRGGNGSSGSGNLASDAVAAALPYRAQAPVVDGFMKELGLDGSSLDKMIAGGTGFQTPVRSNEQVADIQPEILPSAKIRKTPGRTWRILTRSKARANLGWSPFPIQIERCPENQCTAKMEETVGKGGVNSLTPCQLNRCHGSFGTIICRHLFD